MRVEGWTAGAVEEVAEKRVAATAQRWILELETGRIPTETISATANCLWWTRSGH